MNEDTVEIVASYSRKLNMELYGGQPYESSDFFCSMKTVVSAEDNPSESYDELSQFCKDAVDARIEKEIMNMEGGLPQKDFNKMLDNFIHGRAWGGAEDYEAMSHYQKNIFQIIKRSKKRENYKNNKKEDGLQ